MYKNQRHITTPCIKQPMVLAVDGKLGRVTEFCRQYSFGYALRKISLSVLGAKKMNLL
jgi:hypothetical protein